MNDGLTNDMFQVLVGRPATQEDLDYWRGKPAGPSFYAIKDSQGGQALAKLVGADRANSRVTNEDVNWAYLNFAGRPAKDSEKKDWGNKYWHEVIVGVYNSVPAVEYRKANALPGNPALDQATKDQITETNQNTKVIKGTLDGLVAFIKSIYKGGN